jgi:hypothetical protein
MESFRNKQLIERRLIMGSRIEIITDDAGYGKALAGSLAVHYMGISVNTVITDEELGDYFIAGGKRICKYISVHEAAAEIKTALGINAVQRSLLKDRLVIGLVGLHGGCGVSSIAEGLGRTLALFHGKRVLSLCLGNFGSDFCGIGDARLGRLLYESRALDDEAFEERSVQCVSPDPYGVWHLGVKNGYNPLAFENTEFVSEFIEKLMAKLNLNLTILDLGSASDMGPEKMKLLDKTDFTFAVMCSREDMKRASDFENTVRLISGNEGFSITGLIVNHMGNREDIFGTETGAACDFSDDEGIHIEFSPDSFKRSESGVELDISLEFGLCLEKLASKLLEM